MTEETVTNIQEQPIPPKQKLWSALSDAGYYTKAYGDFDKQFSSPAQINKLYSTLKAADYYTKSGEDFNSQFFGEVKKNDSPQGLPNGVDLSGAGLNPFQNSQAPTDLTPVLPQHRDEVHNDQVVRQNRLQQQLNESISAANPELRAQTANLPQKGEEVVSSYKNPTKLQRLQYGLKYITGNALKGVAANTVAPLYYYANKAGLASDEETKQVLDKIQTSDKETFGIKPENLNNAGGVLGATGGLAKMLPSLITAEGTGGASFALQNVGDAALEVQKMKDNGVKFDNHSDDLYINGMGLVGLALGRGTFGKVFSKMPSGLRNAVTKGVVADAMEALGKKGADATAEDVAQTFMTKAAAVPQRVLTHGIDALQTYAKVGTEMSGANIASFGLKNAANVLNGDEKPFKDTTAADLVHGASEPFYSDNFDVNGSPLKALANIATSTAGQFGILHGITNSGMLFKGSPYENPIIDQLRENNSPQAVENIKADLTDIGKQKGLSDEEIDNSHKGVDVLAETVGKLPKQLPKDKLQKGVSLVMGKNQLEQELKTMQEERGKLDPSISDIPDKAEQVVADKIDQANDKLRSLVTGDKITYSKGIGEDEGMFYKMLGGKKEEITPSRYALENLEREGKKSVEQPIVEIPTQPIANEPTTPSPETSAAIQEQPAEPAIAKEDSPAPVEAPVEEVTVDPVRQKAIDAITHGIIGNGERMKGDTSPRFDLGMDTREQRAAIHDITNGKYDTAPAKKMIDKVSEFETKGEYPIIEGLGGKADRSRFATADQIQAHIDEAKQFKLAKEQDIEANNQGLKDLGITHEDIQNYENYRNAGEPGTIPDNGRTVEDTAGNVQRAENDKTASVPQGSGSEATQGQPKSGAFISVRGHDFEFHGKPNASGNYFTETATGKGAYGQREVEKYGKPTSKNAQELLSMVVEDFLKTPYGKESGLFRGETKAGDPLRSFAETIRKGKINKLAGFRASTGFDAIWDGSLEVVATAAEGGAKIADAIEAGLKHVKQSDWYKKLVNKEEFDQQYREHLTNEYADIKKTLPAKNEAMAERAKDLGVELKENNETSRGEEVVEREASAKIKEGYDVHDLIDRIVNDKHAATDTEVAILNKFIDAKETEIRGYNERLGSEGATMGKKAFMDLMASKTQAELDFQDAADANRKTGRLTAQALNARKFTFNKENSLENMVAKKREALGGDKLTPEQLADITKKFSEMEGIQKQLEARVKKVEADNAKLKADQTVKKVNSDRPTRRSVTKTELAAERSKIFDSIRSDFEKIRKSGQAMSDIPYRREFAAIAKHMPALLRNLAQDGLVRIEDVVDNLYETFKGDLPDITKRDVTDLIAGKYNEVKPTKNTIQSDINLLKQQARLINQIEDLENGIAKPKASESFKKTANEKIQSLRDRIKEIKKQLSEEKQSEAQANEPTKEEKSLAAMKKRIQENIDKLNERIKNNDFSKEEPKRPVKPDEEALNLRRKYDKIKQEWDIEVAKDALKQRSKVEKLKDDLLNIASLPRALKASLDFSAVLRQGLFATAGHPREALTAFKEMFNQTFSEEKYKNWISDLKHSEYYDLMKNSDLYLSDKNDPKIIAREEEFTSNLADKIPVIGKAIAASERAYTGYLNVLRAGVFESQARELIKRGYTYENNPEVFKGVAKVVNVLTGRGDIPDVLGGKSPKVLSNVLFSPRFMAARIQTLYLWADPRLPREAKVMAAKDIGATLAVGATLLSLAALAGLKVNTDPRSAQFLKVQDEDKKGSTYYDILGGLPQYVKLLSQIATGKTVSGSGKVTDLSAKRGRANPWGTTRGDIELRFMRGKLSPVVGSAINLQEGKDVVGQPYHFWPNVPQEFIPLPYTDVQDAYKVGGISNALKVFLPAQFGIGVSSY